MKHRFLGFTQVAFWAGQEEEKEFPVPDDHLKHCSLDLTKVEFGAYQVAENDFHVPLNHMIVALSNLKKVARSSKYLQSAFEVLNHRFFDFIDIAFWGGQEAENELTLPCKH